MYIGIDIGGMSVKAGVVTENGDILAKEAVHTPINDEKAMLDALLESVNKAVKSAGVTKDDIKGITIDEIKEKGLEKEFALYELVEKTAGTLIKNQRKILKDVCANVDFYSGFVYSMLGIPEELFTPIFAIARMPGWCAHRLEELINAGKIIRPAYKYVGHHTDFVDFTDR